MSFGNKVGRGLGIAGATLVEGSIRAATGLGSFGTDVVAGAEQGYAERSTHLKAQRAENLKKRDAARQLALKQSEKAKTIAVAKA